MAVLGPAPEAAPRGAALGAAEDPPEGCWGALGVGWGCGGSDGSFVAATRLNSPSSSISLVPRSLACGKGCFAVWDMRQEEEGA